MENPHSKERFKLGIIFNFSSSWMGGIMYILNVIKILDFLDDKEKPEITLFYRSDLSKFVDEINYAYFKAIEWSFTPIYQGYLLSWFCRKNIFVDKILRQYDLDGLYPLQDCPIRAKTRVKLVCWYADLQHKYYPDFFTRRKIIERNTRIRFMLLNSHDLVVSSQAVANDFVKFFRINNATRIHIFHFVSVIENVDEVDISDLRDIYKLPEKYFIVSNQFHKHKNHKILFETLAFLKGRGQSVHIALTGRFPVDSSSHYLKELHKLIELNQLQNQVSLLGTIPRKHQLVLMKYSQAVIQPSLFEGWSTVIEDAKSLQVPVIASNILVNIEQLGSDGIYFEPHNKKNLAEILSNFPARNLNDLPCDENKSRIGAAAKVLIDIFRN